MATVSFRPHPPLALAGMSVALVEVTEAEIDGSVRVADLLAWLTGEGSTATAVALLDRAPGSDTRPQVDRMVVDLQRSGADAVTSWSPVAEALKRERDGLIEAGIDRSDVIEVLLPQVFWRTALVASLAGSSSGCVDPCQALANSGGRIRLYRSER